MKPWLTLFLFIGSLQLQALKSVQVGEQQDSHLVSDEADYDGAVLNLKGAVCLDHKLGVMKAEMASLDRIVEGGDFPFSRAQLQEKVTLIFSGSSQLICDVALFDFIKLEAKAKANPNKKVLFYSKEMFFNKDKRFILESDEIGIQLGKKQEGDKDLYYIQSIQMDKKARLRSESKWSIESPNIYLKQQEEEAKEILSSGRIYSQNEGADLCWMHWGNDTLSAVNFDYCIAKDALYFEKPKATFFAMSLLEDTAPLRFTCDKAFWNLKTQLLELKGNIHCYDGLLGSFNAEDIVKIKLEEKDGKRLVDSLDVEGPSRLGWTEAKTLRHHELRCPGKVSLCNKSMKMHLKAPDTKKVHYEHPLGTLSAKQARVDYTLEEGKYVPYSIQLKGQVELISKGEGKRFCLADRMVTKLKEKKMILSGDEDNKVLFSDEKKGLNIIGTEIHIAEDPVTHEETVQGFGSVRFVFTDAEKELIERLKMKGASDE